MRCEKCGKRRATIHIIEIRDGEMSDSHLCTECSLNEGYTTPSDVNFEEMLQRLLNESSKLDNADEKQEKQPPESPPKPEKTCPECGFTLKALTRNGRFGCENDFQLFREQVKPLFLRIHGASSHRGKLLAGNSELARKQQTIQALENQWLPN